MKSALVVFLLLLTGSAFGQYDTCEAYYGTQPYEDGYWLWQDYSQTAADTFTEENATGYVMSNTWFWDPNESGVGMNISMQRSQAGGSGYFVHGAFYTYKEDGTQAWYTVQGDYTPNSNVNDWREDYELYGMGWYALHAYPHFTSRVREVHGGAWSCFWGNEDSWMGEVDSQLAVTSNGPVLGAGDTVSYPDYVIEAHGDIRLRFKSPSVVEVYLDGESTPSHVMERFSWHGDLRKGDADYLTEGVWHYNSAMYGYAPEGIFYDGFIGSLLVSMGSVNTRFEKIDPTHYNNAPGIWDWVSRRFIDQTEMNDKKHYYISTKKAESIGAGWDSLEFPEDKEHFEWYWHNEAYFILLVYDEEYKTMSLYHAKGINEYEDAETYDEAFTLGIELNGHDYKMEGYLPPEDQRRISMYPSACIQCGSVGSGAFRKETARRSGAHLWQIPDVGDAFEKMPAFLDSTERVKTTTSETKGE